MLKAAKLKPSIEKLKSLTKEGAYRDRKKRFRSLGLLWKNAYWFTKQNGN